MQSDYHNIPQINGHQQVFGDNYKARNTKLNEKQNKFSIDIAKAYPVEAKINNWERSYQLKNKELVIEDVFDINGAQIANEINFLTRGTIDISNLGVVSIQIENEKVELNYDKTQFVASSKTIHLHDSRFTKVWGADIYRITLTAKSISDKGKYKFRIQY